MAIRLNAEDFWEFSLALYCREAVAAACLSLQDRRGADVNLLLAICWLARSGYAVDASAIGAAASAVAAWGTGVLEPLREVRRRLGSDFPEVAQGDRQAIRHDIMAVELECERLAQRRIVAAFAARVGGLQAEPARHLAQAGIDAYLAMLVAEPDAKDLAERDVLLASLQGQESIR